jgi:hypothetical protein
MQAGLAPLILPPKLIQNRYPILPIEMLCFSISVKQLYIVNNNSIFILMNYHSEIIPIENIKVIKS